MATEQKRRSKRKAAAPTEGFRLSKDSGNEIAIRAIVNRAWREGTLRGSSPFYDSTTPPYPGTDA
jgi:hypothetical protein